MTSRKEDPSWRPPNLSGQELAWAEIQPFLSDHGYMLRHRYPPGWTPSWDIGAELGKSDVGDALAIPGHRVMLDAVRLCDKQGVMLRKVKTTTIELSLYMRLSSPPFATPMNHSPPLLDVLMSPNSDEYVILVFRKLHEFNHPPFETTVELLHCLRSFTEGLSFLHKLNIAHRDINFRNLLMDPGSMFPNGYPFMANRDQYQPEDIVNPRPCLLDSPYISRTLAGVYYYIVNGEESVVCLDPKGSSLGRAGRAHGPDNSVNREDGYPSPFSPDAFNLAAIFKKDLLNHYTGWTHAEVMKQWTDKMVHKSSADEALRELDDIIRSVPRSEMDRPLSGKKRRSSGLLLHESRAILSGKNTLVRDLYRGLRPEHERDTMPSLTSRLLSVVRNAAWRR